jgi:serine/threonine protein kinase
VRNERAVVYWVTVLDDPDLLAECGIGDGQAETEIGLAGRVAGQVCAAQGVPGDQRNRCLGTVSAIAPTRHAGAAAHRRERRVPQEARMQQGDGRDDRSRGPSGDQRSAGRSDDMDATQMIGNGPGGGGRIISGRYRLEGLLGTGGMSEVHRGTDLRLNRPVAVKLFRTGADRDSARRFTDEAHTLANLSHPGLVPVYDSGLDGDQPFLVLELVNGWTLREIVDQEQLPLEEISRIGVAIADVLGYVHQQGAVYRDIRPSNVLIGRDNRVRLADFGVASPGDGGRSMLSSPAYLSPEQVRGDWVGPPADVYALGLLVLELVTGRVAYPGGGRAAAEARLDRSPQIPVDLPDGLRHALLDMTDPDPGARPTAIQAASALTLGPPPAPVMTASVAEPPGRNTTNQILVIAIGAVVLAALIGFVAFATGDDSSKAAQSGSSTSSTKTPATSRKITTTERATDDTTTTRSTPKIPTSGVSLPSLPDISLPDSSDVSSSVTDEVKQAWEKYSAWLATLF